MITVHHYLLLSAILFCLGLAGVILRKNLLIVFMSLEVMMNAINLSFVAFARSFQSLDGHVVAILVMAIAAVEAAIGLGLVLAFFRNRQNVDTQQLRSMRG